MSISSISRFAEVSPLKPLSQIKTSGAKAAGGLVDGAPVQPNDSPKSSPVNLRPVVGSLHGLQAIAAKSADGNLPQNARATFQEFVKAFNALGDGDGSLKNRIAQAARGFLQDIRNNQAQRNTAATGDNTNTSVATDASLQAVESKLPDVKTADTSLQSAGTAKGRVIDLTA